MSDRVTDDLLIADLRRVGDAIGGPPTVRQYRKHGSYGDGQVRKRLGGWPGALEKAFGADPRLIAKPASAEALRESLGLTDEDRAAVDKVQRGSKIPTGFAERFGEAFGVRMDRGDEDHCAGPQRATPAQREAREKLADEYATPTPLRVGLSPPTTEPGPFHSRIVNIISDIHFDLHDAALWSAYREWHAFMRPKHTVILGDFVDLGMMSKYAQGPDEPVYAIPQIQMFVREATALLAECEVLTICMGNHDERWQKFLGATNPLVLKGAVGLSLQEQCEAQGLEKSNRVRWFSETNETPALQVAGFYLHHGHVRSGKWGGPKHLAAALLDRGLGQSQIQGHSHRAQLYVKYAFGKTSFGISNPSMCAPMNYHPDADWARGFTILELNAPDYRSVTPYIVVAQDGAFSWGGRTYGVRVAA